MPSKELNKSKTSKKEKTNSSGVKKQRQRTIDAIESEVEIRCKKMTVEANLLVTRIKSAEKLWLMQLPQNIKDMNIKDFLQTYGDGDLTLPPSSTESQNPPKSSEDVQAILHQYFTNPEITADDRRAQITKIKKQMFYLEKLLDRQDNQLVSES
eukprot:TRINITY_DN9110_c0_g1_i1.p1 TRINITY_DN9110_c0_g1~~TRINITY_DN9110_c0_g1_i1.p1  ORF type:complete len:154 (-),score=21.07 TRINITY_DN9110_c0_g1_i1:70-531(-)